MTPQMFQIMLKISLCFPPWNLTDSLYYAKVPWNFCKDVSIKHWKMQKDQLLPGECMPLANDDSFADLSEDLAAKRNAVPFPYKQSLARPLVTYFGSRDKQLTHAPEHHFYRHKFILVDTGYLSQLLISSNYYQQLSCQENCSLIETTFFPGSPLSIVLRTWRLTFSWIH